MKKIFLIVLVLMSFVSFAYATPISQQWIKAYGDFFSSKPILQTIDGGYVVAGSTIGDHNICVLKLDSNGEISWLKKYPYYGSWLNDLYGIVEIEGGGGYIAVGTYGSGTLVRGWMLRLDDNGNIIWQKIYNEVVQFYSIEKTADGGFITVGDSIPDSNTNIIVLKLNSTGDIVWQKSYDIIGPDKSDFIKQTLDGGYVVTGHIYFSTYDIFVLKLNSNGDVSWLKRYDGDGGNTHPFIQETLDGGFILATSIFANSASEDVWVIKLDSNGNIEWQKTYGGDTYDTGVAIQQIPDGGYVVIGYTKSFGHGGKDVWLWKLDNSGNIEWQKTYGDTKDDGGTYFGNTQDGGYVIAGFSNSFEPSGLMVLKFDSNGEIPGCDIEDISNATVSDTTAVGQDIGVIVETPSITFTDTDAISQDVSIRTSAICYYEDPNDIDGDGVENTPDESLTSNLSYGSFLAEGDNCSQIPNGPYLGTCTQGKVGSTCITNEACGVDGSCSMYQEDSYPPQGNGIGDVCDCEGNFDCDSDCDGTDAAVFKTDFGRSTFDDPCEADNPCKGDFDCDSDCDGTDAALFKQDFGRGTFNSPCPGCVVGEWCGYPLP